MIIGADKLSAKTDSASSISLHQHILASTGDHVQAFDLTQNCEILMTGYEKQGKNPYFGDKIVILQNIQKKLAYFIC